MNCDQFNKIQLTSIQQDYAQYKIQKNFHKFEENRNSSNDQKNLISDFEYMKKKNCSLEIKNLLLEGFKERVLQQIAHERNLHHLNKKIACKSLKNQDDYQNQRSNYESISTKATLQMSNKNSMTQNQFAMMASNNNNNYNLNYQRNEKMQKEILLQQKIEVRNVEQDLLAAKKQRNQVAVVFDDKMDELIDVKTSLREIQKLKNQKESEIIQLQKMINDMSKNGQITNKHYISMANPNNMTKLNTTIIDDVQNTLRNLKDNLRKRIFSSHGGQDKNNNNNNNILNDLDQ